MLSPRRVTNAIECQVVSHLRSVALTLRLVALAMPQTRPLCARRKPNQSLTSMLIRYVSEGDDAGRDDNDDDDDDAEEEEEEEEGDDAAAPRE